MMTTVGKPTTQERPGAHGKRSRGQRAQRGVGPRPASVTASGSSIPPPGIAFYTPDGSICHYRCGRPLVFLGRRGGIEMDFYCEQCVEHVTLPECILSRIPSSLATS
jgi:hypothetical protein